MSGPQGQREDETPTLPTSKIAGPAPHHRLRPNLVPSQASATEEHPYEVPGISTRTITDGNPDYLGVDRSGDCTGTGLAARTRDRIGLVRRVA